MVVQIDVSMAVRGDDTRGERDLRREASVAVGAGDRLDVGGLRSRGAVIAVTAREARDHGNRRHDVAEEEASHAPDTICPSRSREGRRGPLWQECTHDGP